MKIKSLLNISFAILFVPHLHSMADQHAGKEDLILKYIFPAKPLWLGKALLSEELAAFVTNYETWTRDEKMCLMVNSSTESLSLTIKEGLSAEKLAPYNQDLLGWINSRITTRQIHEAFFNCILAIQYIANLSPLNTEVR